MTNQSLKLRTAITELTGIVIAENKEYLLATRLEKLMEDYQLPNYDAVASKLLARDDIHFNDSVVDAITICETSFFRDPSYFEAFVAFLIDYRSQKNTTPLRIWSAACSTGQEPYSILMTLYNSLPELIPQVELLATDLSGEALAKAESGLYSPLELKRGLAAAHRTKFFQLESGNFRFRNNYRAPLRFEPGNLIESAPPGPWDVIFMRNVTIYFSDSEREKILRNVFASLNPGGILIAGASESILSYLTGAEIVEYGKAKFYRKTS